MKDQFNAEMRRKLLAMRQELVAVTETGNEASRIVELDQSTVGRLSRMDAMQAQAMSQACRHRRGETLEKIELALKKIEVDKFGHCRDCHEPIARKRLQVDPTILLCMVCASRAER